MTKRKWWSAVVFLILAGAIAFSVEHFLTEKNNSERGDILSLMPSDASAVLFVDAVPLRQAPFFAEIFAWAPKPQADADYSHFLQATGFDYERDLDRVAITVKKRGQDSLLFAIADGKFDRKKIAAYATKYGTVEKKNGHDVFSIAMNDSPRKISFTFLSNSRVALTDDADLSTYLSTKEKNIDSREWETRFERLAGSPIFAVVRQDAGAGAALSAQAPGGLRSPQLSSLLDQLQWISLAGKPEGNALRVVADGECTSDAIIKQLTDMLNGIVILAQGGLNDSKARQQLDPTLRSAYLDLLNSSDVSKLDRGQTKSIRVLFLLTPQFLEAARKPSPPPPPAPEPKKPVGKKPVLKK